MYNLWVSIRRWVRGRTTWRFRTHVPNRSVYGYTDREWWGETQDIKVRRFSNRHRSIYRPIPRPPIYKAYGEFNKPVYRVEFDPKDAEMCSVFSFDPLRISTGFDNGMNSYVHVDTLPVWMRQSVNTLRVMDSGPKFNSNQLPQGIRIDEHTFWLDVPDSRGETHDA